MEIRPLRLYEESSAKMALKVCTIKDYSINMSSWLFRLAISAWKPWLPKEKRCVQETKPCRQSHWDLLELILILCISRISDGCTCLKHHIDSQLFIWTWSLTTVYRQISLLEKYASLLVFAIRKYCQHYLRFMYAGMSGWETARESDYPKITAFTTFPISFPNTW